MGVAKRGVFICCHISGVFGSRYIRRPLIDPYLTMAGAVFETDIKPTAICADASSDACFEIMSAWLGKCIASHKLCWLPRVLKPNMDDDEGKNKPRSRPRSCRVPKPNIRVDEGSGEPRWRPRSHRVLKSDNGNDDNKVEPWWSRLLRSDSGDDDDKGDYASVMPLQGQTCSDSKLNGNSRSEGQKHILPLRVIDVGSDTIDPFLFVPKHQVGNWVALSHCVRPCFSWIPVLYICLSLS